MVTTNEEAGADGGFGGEEADDGLVSGRCQCSESLSEGAALLNALLNFRGGGLPRPSTGPRVRVYSLLAKQIQEEDRLLGLLDTQINYRISSIFLCLPETEKSLQLIVISQISMSSR